MADLFKELLSSVDSLNEEQVNTLLSRLNEKKAGQEQETSKLVRNLETVRIVGVLRLSKQERKMAGKDISAKTAKPRLVIQQEPCTNIPS